MKKILTIGLAFMSATSFNALAVPSCPGRVAQILEWPNKCNGNLAFKLDSTHGSWLCTLSKRSESMVLTAYASEATIVPRLNDDIPCSSIDDYHIPMYIVLRD